MIIYSDSYNLCGNDDKDYKGQSIVCDKIYRFYLKLLSNKVSNSVNIGLTEKLSKISHVIEFINQV